MIWRLLYKRFNRWMVRVNRFNSSLTKSGKLGTEASWLSTEPSCLGTELCCLGTKAGCLSTKASCSGTKPCCLSTEPCWLGTKANWMGTKTSWLGTMTGSFGSLTGSLYSMTGNFNSKTCNWKYNNAQLPTGGLLQCASGFGAPRGVRIYINQIPIRMKEPYNPICRSGWSPADTLWGNELCEAQQALYCKLHQSGLVSRERYRSISRSCWNLQCWWKKWQNANQQIPGVMWCCVQCKGSAWTWETLTWQRSPTVDEGVGYAHSSDDNRKGKNGRSEGALL